MIVKPLGGRGGEGIFHVRRDDRNLFSMLEQTTRFGTRLAMAQRYLPGGAPRRQAHPAARRRAARRGAARAGRGRDAREPARRAGARRRPRSTTTTGASSSGSRPWLERDGLYFVGIDVIGGRLTEVNVTSPTGIQEMNALDGARYEERVLERVEQRMPSARRRGPPPDARAATRDPGTVGGPLEHVRSGRG